MARPKVQPKARRIAYSALLAVIISVGIVPLATTAITATSGHSTHLDLVNASAVDYAFGFGNGSYHPLAIASTNGTTTVTPSYTVLNGTNGTKTVYPTEIVLETNLTVANLNSYSVSQFVTNVTGASNFTAALDYGSAVGDTVTLTPMVQANITGNSSVGLSASMDVQAMMLTGNQSSTIFVVLTFSASPTVAFTVHNYVYGTAAASNSYVIGEDIGYIAGGIGLFLLVPFILPFSEVHLMRTKQEPYPSDRKKKA